MIHLIYTVYDQKAEAYLQPFFVQTEGLAIRSFSDCVNSDSHQFGKHPEDYTLIELGTFDDNGPTFDTLVIPKTVGTGLDFITKRSMGANTDG